MNSLIIYPRTDWNNNGRRHLHKALSNQLKEYTILVVNRPLCPFTTFLKKPRRIFNCLKSMKKPLQITHNLYFFTPWVFINDQLVLNSQFLTNINRRILRYQIKKCLLKILFKTEKIISWISEPLLSNWVGLADEQYVIFECVDEYATYPGLSQSRKKNILNCEKKLLDRADIVFVVSKKLLYTKGKQNPNIYYIPNAVDFEHFNKAIAKETVIPDDIESIPKPVIGFIGGIWGIFDVKLISYIASSRPEWSVVLIGNLASRGPKSFFAKFKELTKLTNIYWLGWKDYRFLPNYLKAIDVCLLPYVSDEWTRNFYPNKVHQYLAAGKPIVSTDFPEIRPFSNVVKISKTHEEFLATISDSLVEGRSQLALRRIKVAAKNTWDMRAQRINEIIKETIG